MQTVAGSSSQPGSQCVLQPSTSHSLPILALTSDIPVHVHKTKKVRVATDHSSSESPASPRKRKPLTPAETYNTYRYQKYMNRAKQTRTMLVATILLSLVFVIVRAIMPKPIPCFEISMLILFQWSLPFGAGALSVYDTIVHLKAITQNTSSLRLILPNCVLASASLAVSILILFVSKISLSRVLFDMFSVGYLTDKNWTASLLPELIAARVFLLSMFCLCSYFVLYSIRAVPTLKHIVVMCVSLSALIAMWFVMRIKAYLFKTSAVSQVIIHDTNMPCLVQYTEAIFSDFRNVHKADLQSVCNVFDCATRIHKFMLGVAFSYLFGVFGYLYTKDSKFYQRQKKTPYRFILAQIVTIGLPLCGACLAFWATTFNSSHLGPISQIPSPLTAPNTTIVAG
ncbi:hypothetical protein NEDG_00920 [Nematocida displodere]|uniref:Uncharacterized protein n=1 Tax=Nematocida displodere TaxID=1805483 RepID=A0A177EB95_9MICR|nr:hypothetical protein NEDG_00920 [Nematocida displodere]